MTDDDDDYIPSKILHKMQEPAPQMRDPIPSKILYKMQECVAEMQTILRDPNSRAEVQIANITFPLLVDG